MTKKKTKVNPIEEIKDLVKKQLILDLFTLNIRQGDIAKKLRTDIKVVNEFLKGLKKK